MEAEKEVKRRRRKANPDRIVLEPDVLATINRLQEQVGEAFGGLVRLTNREMVNFVLVARSQKLSSDELKRIREDHFDEVKAVQWALSKLKAAKDRGEDLNLSKIMSELETPFKEARLRKPGSPKRESTTGERKEAIVDAVTAPLDA